MHAVWHRSLVPSSKSLYNHGARRSWLIPRFHEVGQPFQRTVPACRAKHVFLQTALLPCTSANRQLNTSVQNYSKHAHTPEVAPAEQYNMLIPDLFRESVKKYPSSIALDGPSLRLSYKELDAQTDLLAAFLRTKYRAAPEAVVGIYMERCEEYVIALLAIFKSGAAYCPVELAYPGPLLRSVFDEVSPRVVLTKSAYTNNIPMSISHFSLDGDWQGILKRTAPDPAVLQENKATPESLGYVIYSGGSTGKPKGIEAPHRSMVASYLWRYSISGYGPGARVGCNVFFVWEVLRPLFRGGTSIVIPDDIIFDTERLASYMEAKAITEVLFTPSLFETLLSTTDVGFLRSLPLQVVWLNGEVVTTKLIQQAREHLPHVSFCNTYSISECGEVCAGRLDADREDCPKFCPVGHVASFAQHKLMDPEAGEPVPRGEAGELWISGPGVGRGYTNNPTKTAEVFINYEGRPFYRTGDLARELHDGVLEILGRCDFMVKVRGYSVVLGSVEAAIFKLVGVSQCCVVAKGEEGTDKRIAAYLCPCPDAELKGRLQLATAGIDEFGRCPTLFQELLKELPHYAVPSVFVVLQSIPLNKASTKTDRSALPPLPAPPPAAVIPADFHFDGSTAASQLVFEEVLALPAGTLTLESNFFEFGGHSLLATQLLARVAALGGPKVPVAKFVKAPTVAGLASLARGDEVVAEPMRYLPHEVEKHTHGKPDISLNVQAFWRYIVFTNSSTRVLVTGATGYVGAHLVARLLQPKTTQVFCVVRAKAGAAHPEQDARKRLLDHLDEQGLGDLDVSRLQVIPGDVSLPNLGINEDEYLFLQQLVDVVVHAAANVNLAYTYDLLEATNVHGTAHAIDFARGGKVKAFHFISTDGIFPETGPLGSFKEMETPPHHLLQSGYGQTKWVAEQLVLKARQMGLPSVIYRLGNVGGPSHGNSWNGSDSNLLFLRACLQRGVVPEGDWSLEFTPVDFIADFIGNCVSDLRFANSKNFHLINKTKIPMHSVAQAAERVGFPICRKDKAAWCEASQSEGGLLSVVLGHEALESLLGLHHVYGQDCVEEACRHFDISYPQQSEATLISCLRRLIEQKILPDPPLPLGRLGGRVALVTGANGCVGSSVARALSSEGASVVLVDGEGGGTQVLSSELHGAASLACDVASKEEVRSLMSKVEDRMRRLDIVVNCSSSEPSRQKSSGHLGSIDQWESMVDVTCKGTAHMCSAALPLLLKATGGHIVNVGSHMPSSSPFEAAAYGASQAFLGALSKGLRAAHGDVGLRVTDIRPPEVMDDSPTHADDVATAVLHAVCSPANIGIHEVLLQARIRPAYK